MKKNRARLSGAELHENLWAYFFIFPALFFFALFVIYPLIHSVYVSMMSGLGKGAQWVGLKNYLELFQNEVFMKSLSNTFAFVLLIVPATVLFALFAAAVIIDKTPGAQTFFRAAFYLPAVLSIVSVALVWNNMYNYNYGILNYFVSLWGGEAVNFLGSADLVKLSMSVIVLTYSMGQPIILYLAALGGVPITYYEAAEIDGASGWKKFVHITVPLIMPTTLYILVTTTVGAFQIFAIINLTTSGGPNYASSTILSLIYSTAFTFGDFSKASAMGIILFLCVAALGAVQFTMFSRSEER